MISFVLLIASHVAILLGNFRIMLLFAPMMAHFAWHKSYFSCHGKILYLVPGTTLHDNRGGCHCHFVLLRRMKFFAITKELAKATEEERKQFFNFKTFKPPP